MGCADFFRSALVLVGSEGRALSSLVLKFGFFGVMCLIASRIKRTDRIVSR